MAQSSLTRRRFQALALGGAVGTGAPRLVSAQAPAPKLGRIRGATVTAPDIDALVPHYENLLGYGVVEEGTVSTALASSWGAPATAGKRYLVMQAATREEVFVRAVEMDTMPEFRALTTWGWNSIEFVVEDTDALHQDFLASPLAVLGAPAQLGAFPRIRAMQIQAPGEVLWHLTAETEDWDTSILPRPRGPVGSIIILILAVPGVAAVNDWYAAAFGMNENAIRQSPIGVVNIAQGHDGSFESDATFLAMGDHGNFLELWSLDETRATDRKRPDGQLPPGLAMAGFTAPDLDALDLDFIAPPAVYDGVFNGGRRSATFVGPVGELVELIEESS